MKARLLPKQLFTALIFLFCVSISHSVVGADQPPSIPRQNLQPQDRFVSLGVDVAFKVGPAGTEPLSLQWRFEQNPISGETNKALSIGNVQMSHAGGYDVVITNLYGAITSRVAVLQVDPTFTKITEGEIVTDLEISYSGSWFDYDRDGDMDLFVANGEATDSLYRNEGDGTFSKLEDLAFLNVARDSYAGVWFDADLDGDHDLLVIHPNQLNHFYRQELDGTFTHVETALPKTSSGHYNGLIADFNLDGWADVFIPVWDDQPDLLFRNDPQGGFIAEAADFAGTVLTTEANTFDASWCDYDNDGDPDLFVNYFNRPSELYRNDRKAGFVRVTEALFVDSPASVGGTWGDFDNDGDFDLLVLRNDFVSPNTSNALFRNLGSEGFEDVAETSGLAESLNSMGGAWGDYDNDGDLDLFLVNFERANQFYRNEGNGVFSQTDVGSPIRDGVHDYSPSWVDFDNDGFLDLFFVSGAGQSEPNHLFRNSLPAAGNVNHWLKVSLNGLRRALSKTLSVGAKVRVLATINGVETWQVRQISANNAYHGGSESIAHFGLGDATQATRVVVEWPSGHVVEKNDIAADRLLQVRESRYITAFMGTFGNTVKTPSGSVGGSLGLRVVEADEYQWQRDGLDLPGETQRTLLLDDLKPEDEGRYSVRVKQGEEIFVYYTYVHIDTAFEVIAQGDPVEGSPYSNMAAWGDYDNDGFIDLFVSNRGGVSGGFNSPAQQLLYHNNGDGTFSLMGAAEVGSLATDLLQSGMASWGDYDNDGDLDLLAGSVSSPAHLYENLGNGGFALAEEKIGINQYSTWGLGWADANGDGWLDVAYANQSTTSVRLAGSEGVFAIHPDYSISSSSSEFVCWGDADNDGRADIYIGDHNGGMFYTSKGNRGLALQPNLDGGWWGAWGDYDNDGDLDLYAQTVLLNNDGTGVLTPSEARLPRGTVGVFGDYDNDGDLDLLCTLSGGGTGLFQNDGKGNFTAATIGTPVNIESSGAGCAMGDYNNDGALDLFICTPNSTANQLYRGRPNGNHWLIVRLHGTTSNRSAFGAKVRVQTIMNGSRLKQMRQISGSPFDDLRAHFGLGESMMVGRLTIEWPSGTVQRLSGVAADQILDVIEPPRPILTGSMTEAGGFAVELTATPEQRCRIESSEDLRNWSPVTEVVGSIQLEESEPAPQTKFYRAIVVD